MKKITALALALLLTRRKREDAAELADIPSEDRLCEDLQLLLRVLALRQHVGCDVVGNGLDPRYFDAEIEPIIGSHAGVTHHF